jgi:hypothetical protein
MAKQTGPALLALPAALLLSVVGCGQENPALEAVRGRVYYQGTPLAGGTIVFTPDADKGGRGPFARGEIRPDGSYTLASEGQPGAATGWHRVTIVSVQAATDKPIGTAFADVRSLLPRKYAAPDLSGLEGCVRPGEENVIDFHLD